MPQNKLNAARYAAMLNRITPEYDVRSFLWGTAPGYRAGDSKLDLRGHTRISLAIEAIRACTSDAIVADIYDIVIPPYRGGIYDDPRDPMFNTYRCDGED